MKTRSAIRTRQDRTMLIPKAFHKRIVERPSQSVYQTPMSITDPNYGHFYKRNMFLLYRDLLKGLTNVSNNAPRKKEMINRRKTPARSSLVARSMRGGVFRKINEYGKSKRPKQRKLTKSLAMNKKSYKLRKAKEKMAAVRKGDLQKPLEHNTPSTSGDKSQVKPKCLEAMADLVNQTRGNPQPYFLRSIKAKPKPKPIPKLQEVQRKTKPHRRLRITPAITKKAVDESTQEWPSLGESSRQKGLVKTAATEIVRNKQSGTINRLTKQTYSQSLTKQADQTNSGEKSCSTLQPNRTWAAVAAPLIENFKKETRLQKSLQDSQGKNSRTSRRSVEKDGSRKLPDSSRRLTIERRRGRSLRHTPATATQLQHPSPNNSHNPDTNLQEDVAQHVSTSDLLQSTSKGVNGQLMWKIDNMPESLRFTKPARNLVSLKENLLEAAKINYYDVNKCNNRRICLGDFIADNKTDSMQIRKNQGRGKNRTDHFSDNVHTNTPNNSLRNNDLVHTNEDSIQIKRDLLKKTCLSSSLLKLSNCEESSLKQPSPDCYNRKSETDICSLLDHVTFQRTPVTGSHACTGSTDNDIGGNLKIEQNSSSKKQQKPTPTADISSPKKISHRYRALLRGTVNHMSPKALTEAVTRKKKDDALQETKAVTRGKRKKQQRKLKQKSLDGLRIEQQGYQPENSVHQNNELENFNDLLHQQGTSSSFSQTEPRSEEPTISLEKSRESINIKNVLSPMSHLNSDGKPDTLCYSDDRDEESDSDNLSIIYQTRQEVERRNAGQSRGVNKIPNVILCDESDEEDKEPSNVEGLLDGHISPDDCKDSNNSFVKDLRKGCSDYDLLPGNTTDMKVQASWSQVSVSRGHSLPDMSADVITRIEQTTEATHCGDIDVDWWMMCLFGER